MEELEDGKGLKPATLKIQLKHKHKKVDTSNKFKSKISAFLGQPNQVSTSITKKGRKSKLELEKRSTSKQSRLNSIRQIKKRRKQLKLNSIIKPSS